ncbi:MAG: translocation/assembly module TamB domain-containing protein [Bacteroidetes bacterium]|nr:translocation/assembly module TamB domain-containing protein [Bacteroidota bacterium]
MKSKVIKKALRIVLYFFGALLLLFMSLYFALLSPAFQTWAANRIAGYFSSQWGTTVRVEGVDIELWKKIVLEGVYLEDKHRDTLLYAEKLKLDIGKFERDSQNIFINNAIFQNATVKIKKYENDSAFNFQFIVDEFSSNDTSHTAGKKWKFGMGGISLENIRFAYRIEKDTSRLKGINFSDIQASSVSAKFSDVKLNADTIRCVIKNFSLREKSGFQLKEFYARASVSPVYMNFDELKVISNNSRVLADFSLSYRDFDNFNHYNDSVIMNAHFNSSDIEMADIAYFTDELYGIKKKVFLKGDASGTVSDLKGKNIFLVIGGETSFRGDLSITGLPNIDQTFMSFDARELMTSRKGIESIPLPPFSEQHSISVPENISLFGAIKFKGNFTGFYNDFVAYGKFNTALGGISTDISLKNDSASGMAVYHGKFSCADFNLGKYFSSERYFGRISMNVDVDGKGLRKDNTNVIMDGTAGSFEFNGYNYKNIDVKGKFAKNIFDGSLAIKDENVDLDFNGTMDFSKSPTQVNFNSTITKANLSKLNFIKSDEYVDVSAKIIVNAVGTNLDDAIGKITLNNVAYVKGVGIFDFKNLELTIADTLGNKTMNLHSFVADAHLSGKFKPMEVASCLNDFLSNYLPSYIPRIEASVGVNRNSFQSRKYIEHLQKFSFDVQIKNTDFVTRAFMPTLSIATPASMKGNYDEEKNDFSLEGSFPSISIQKYKFNNCSITSSSKDKRLSIQTACQRFAFSDSVWIDNISLVSTLAKDTLDFKLNWHNISVEQYSGNIPGYIAFSEKPKIKLKLRDSQITIADSAWKIDADNEVVKDSSFVSVSHLNFYCGNQRVKMEGSFSKVKEDKMYLFLSSFSLSNFNSALKGTGVSLNGTITGNSSFSSMYDKPVFGSSIDIENLKVNKEVIGNGNLSSVYDSQKDWIRFEGGFKRDEVGNMRFVGNYFPSKKDSSLTVDATVNDIHLDFFDPFIKPNFQDMRGTASAQLQINGSINRLLLTGVVKTKVDNIHVNYLGTDYHFNGEVQVEPNSFDFSKLHVYDVNNNVADVLNGKIFHANFKDFQLDFDLNANKFFCLNTTEKDNSIYYGKVFATGIVNVYGLLDNINLSANVKTDKAKNFQNKNEYSQLFIPLSNAEEVGANSFVTFVKQDTSLKINQPKYKVNTTGFTMNLKVEPTADAQVQLIFDEKVGDVIKAKGTGNMDLLINEFGDFKMYGEYLVDNGDYLFTLKNLVNKKFKMENGGTVRWSGNPTDADINISAVYSLRTSISPLFPPTETSDIYKKRYPVECVMNLTGKLMAPDIKFDIKMPGVDDFIRQQALEKFKNSENELNQQVFSLLVMNSFVTPSGLGTAPPSSPQISSSGMSAEVTSSEMLSNQLSNWFSQISKSVDLGVHYRPGDEINSKQVELALSTQLFNNKLTIDGNVANNSNTLTNQNTSAIVGDVNVNYKLTDNGNWRVKAFDKANEGDLLNLQKGPYTQGLGILYRKEFERVFKRKSENKYQP